MNKTRLILRAEAPDTATLAFGPELLTDPGFASAPDWTYYNNDGGHAQAVSLGAGGMRETVPSPVDYVQQGYYSTPSGGGVPCYYKITVVTGTIDSPLDGSANCAIYACYGGHCAVFPSPASNTTYTETFYASSFDAGVPALGDFLVMVAIGDPAADGCAGGENFDVASASLAKSTTCAVATSYELETRDTTPVPITYAVGDVADPSARAAAYTKTVSLPGTKNNCDVLGHAFKLDIADCAFDRSARIGCEVIQDGIAVLRGDLQLLRAEHLPSGELSFDVAVSQRAASLFDRLGDHTVADLDLSDLDHSVEYSQVVASWSTPDAPVVYPLVDYGRGLTHTGTRGLGISTRGAFTGWLRPWLRVRELLVRSFALAGFRLQSDFVDGDYFRRLITDLGDGTVHAGTREAIVTIGLSTTWSGSWVSYTVRIVDLGADGREYIPLYTDVRDPASTDLNYITWRGPLPPLSRVTFEITVTESSPWGSGDGLVIQPGSYVQVVYAGTSAFAPAGDFRAELTAPIGPLTNPMDPLRIDFDDDSTLPNGDPYGTWYTNYHTVPPTSMTSLVNSATKLRDLVDGLVKMFNLYIEHDLDDQTLLRVEPRDDYYDGSTLLRDWTAKLDRSQPLVADMPVPDRSMRMAYSSDSDYFNADYEARTGKTWGEVTVSSGGDFAENDREVTVALAGTPMKSLRGTSYNMPVSQLGVRASIEDPWEVSEALAPRVLHFLAIDVSGDPTVMPGPQPARAWYLDGSLQTTLPYAGHLDDPENPGADLNWGPCEFYYTGDTTVTDQGLFNRFHRRGWDEAADADARVVTGRFVLSPADVATLRLNDRIYLDGVHYRIDKVADYDPGADGTTAVTLVRATDIRYPAAGVTVVERRAATPKEPAVVDSRAVASGDTNAVDAGSPGSVVSGRNNRIGSNSPGSAIIGGYGNVVPDDTPGVVMIGVSGITSPSPNTVYLPDVVAGLSGISGYSGATTSGYSGYSGYSGRSGYSGGAGASGYSGHSGSGYSGFSGRSGYSGYSGFSGASGAGDNDGGYSNYLQFNNPVISATALHGTPLYLTGGLVYVAGTGLKFFTTTGGGAIQQGPLTAQATTTFTYGTPGTYAVASPATAGGLGFASADEADTLVYTIAKLTARVAELEAALQAYGLLV